mmetsp:Transcript_25244/g.60743  ORF Transcript_25244/g.60743 Transcript_25244/m.60743 type:complete len:237 (-) Transcript_25244:381-1091(-)
MVSVPCLGLLSLSAGTVERKYFDACGMISSLKINPTSRSNCSSRSISNLVSISNWVSCASGASGSNDRGENRLKKLWPTRTSLSTVPFLYFRCTVRSDGSFIAYHVTFGGLHRISLRMFWPMDILSSITYSFSRILSARYGFGENSNSSLNPFLPFGRRPERISVRYSITFRSFLFMSWLIVGWAVRTAFQKRGTGSTTRGPFGFFTPWRRRRSRLSSWPCRRGWYRLSISSASSK